MKEQIDAYLDQLLAAHQLSDPTQIPLKTLLGVPPGNEIIQKCLRTMAYHMKQAILTIGMILAAVSLAHLSVTLRPIQATSNSSVQASGVLERVDTPLSYVSLTFDVGYDATALRSILIILNKHQVKATFFITQSWLDANPKLTRAILDLGHDLGNMGDDVLQMHGGHRAAIEEELRTLHQEVEELMEYEMFLFRPPHGEYDASLLQAAVSLGYISVGGEIDSLDWKEYGSAAVCREVLDNPKLSAGSIIRGHCSSVSMGEALDELLAGLAEKKLKVVPLSVLMEQGSVQLD
ncbi:MAG: polysaccharide deacetylase family protein [Clostridium sp.]|nr:polysaccharide deacetylase family protein [Clostridium sp.]